MKVHLRPNSTAISRGQFENAIVLITLFTLYFRSEEFGGYICGIISPTSPLFKHVIHRIIGDTSDEIFKSELELD